MQRSLRQWCFTTLPVLFVTIALFTGSLPPSGAAAATPRSVPGLTTPRPHFQNAAGLRIPSIFVWDQKKLLSPSSMDAEERASQTTLIRRPLSAKECTTNCENAHEKTSTASVLHRWTMPLVTLGDKQYYLGIFFKANWYKSYQFCRYHGLHLVSIESLEENNRMEEFVKNQGLFNEHFWTSGTDQAEEGTFFWMGTGRPIGFTNWNAGEPNNFRYENGEEEHCLELWNRDGKGLKWNDSPCSFETYFICEKQD